MQAFSIYKKHPMALPLESLTPTSYPVLQGSIYAPRIPMNDFLVVILLVMHQVGFLVSHWPIYAVNHC